MPKDEWAASRQRDVVRRAKHGKSWSSVPRSKKRRKKAAPGPARIPIRLKIGQIVQIRRNDNEPWKGHEMRKALTLNVPYPITTEWVEMQYFDWRLRIPRPRDFQR
jgi:hypothetical protein